MVNIVGIAVGRASLWHYLTGREGTCLCPIFCVEGTKDIVVGSVLLNKEDDVADFLDTYGRSCWLRAGE